MNKPQLSAQILGMYVGRPCTINGSNEAEIFTHGIFHHWRNGSYKSITPHLRRLESITEEECRHIYKMHRGQPIYDKVSYKSHWWDCKDEFDVYRSDIYVGSPKTWLYLLSRGFDLFELIDAGLAKEVEQ